jgi:hypothetical protein
MQRKCNPSASSGEALKHGNTNIVKGLYFVSTLGRPETQCLVRRSIPTENYIIMIGYYKSLNDVVKGYTLSLPVEIEMKGYEFL